MGNVNVILDEAASLGPNMGCIEDAIDKYRGYGIRLQLYYQALSQLKKCFGDQDQTVLSNTTQVFFGLNDASAEYVSNRLGDQTIIVDSGGSGNGYSSQSSNSGSPGNSTSSRNDSKNWTQAARRLLKFEELLALNERIAITFLPGLPPVITRLRRYYEGNDHDRIPGHVVLVKSLVLVLMGTVCLIAALDLWKGSQHGGSLQRAQRNGSRDGSGTETSGNPGPNGTREFVVQRQRIRAVRPGPIHPDS